MTEVTNTTNFFNTLAPVVYTTKSGKSKVAHNEISQALMPAAIRKAQASSQALESLKRGVYRPTLAAIAALMTKGDIKSLKSFGVMPSDNPTKKEVVHFLKCIALNWAEAKGEKAAQAALCKEFVEWTEAKPEPTKQAEPALM